MTLNVTTPLISVYIPTRNRASLLRRALDSVLLQDYPNVEILVIDDASTDDTESMLASHPKRDCFSVARMPEPSGAPAARNHAIARARGALITGMDDDDAFLPTRLSELLEQYLTGKWSCVASTCIERYAIGDIVRHVDTGIIDYDAIRHYNKIGNQVLTETSRLREIGGFDTRLPAFQDYDTWIRLIERFGPAFKLRRPTYLAYLSHDSNRISDDRDKVRRGFEMFVNKHEARLEPRHRRSMRLLSHAVEGTRLGPLEFARNVNNGNYKMAIPLLINSNPSLRHLKRAMRWLRFRRST
jgi:glycosyltransferase involved in cell wall biosynthesis